MSEVPAPLQQALADRYEIEREVGRGGSASVYLANDLKHGRQVALKVFRPEFGELLGRDHFLEEIQTTAKLEHPHILSLYDSGEAAGHLYYVMPYVSDGSLRDRIERAGQLPVDRAVEIIKQVAGALDYAHSLGIIHRDLKPENILLPGGHAMLSDFGIAKVVDDAGRSKVTEAGFSFGTAEYMSPEQASGDQAIDIRSDVYSLGAVLYEMLVGQPPFTGSTIQVVLGKILTERPTRPRDVRETVPHALDGAIMRSLSRLAADRFSSVQHFSEALVTVDRRRGGRREPRGLPWPALWGGAALVGVVGWFASAYFGGGSDVTPLPVPQVSPFLTGPEIVTEPASSPTGNLIAYVSDEAGNEDVWIADPSGSNPINLTEGHAGRDVHPAWSPDGQQVAFVSDREGGGLYSMSALGGAVTRIAPVVFDGGTGSRWIPLQWADDGSIVYTSRDSSGSPQVYRIPDGGTAVECMTCDLEPGGGHSGHLLPGGTHLVFRSTHGPEPAGVLYVAELATGGVREIGAGTALPRWSPALDRLFFVSVRDGAPDLWALALDLDSGEPAGDAQRVTAGIAPSGLAVSPNGGLLIARTRTESSIWSFPLGPVDGFADGAQITAGTEFVDAKPRWMPGGSAVVFESNRRGSPDLWLIDVRAGTPSRLTSEAAADGSPRPSPDGAWIAFERRSDDATSIRLVRAEGGGEVEPDPAWADRFSEACCVSWAPDGRSFAFAVVEGSGLRRLAIADVDPATGHSTGVRILDVPGESQERPRFSPDGAWIAYEARGEGDWDLWLVDADGTNPRRVTSSPMLERQAAWAPDQSALYFIDDLQDVWRLPLDGGGNPSGGAELWFDVPARYGAGEDGLDIGASGLLLAIEELAGDIWVVSFPPRESGD